MSKLAMPVSNPMQPLRTCLRPPVPEVGAPDACLELAERDWETLFHAEAR